MLPINLKTALSVYTCFSDRAFFKSTFYDVTNLYVLSPALSFIVGVASRLDQTWLGVGCHPEWEFRPLLFSHSWTYRFCSG